MAEVSADTFESAGSVAESVARIVWSDYGSQGRFRQFISITAATWACQFIILAYRPDAFFLSTEIQTVRSHEILTSILDNVDEDLVVQRTFQITGIIGPVEIKKGFLLHSIQEITSNYETAPMSRSDLEEWKSKDDISVRFTSMSPGGKGLHPSILTLFHARLDFSDAVKENLPITFVCLVLFYHTTLSEAARHLIIAAAFVLEAILTHAADAQSHRHNRLKPGLLRICFGVLCVLVEILVTLIVLGMGTFLVLQSEGPSDIILNAVAMKFVFDIDNILIETRKSVFPDGVSMVVLGKSPDVKGMIIGNCNMNIQRAFEDATRPFSDDPVILRCVALGVYMCVTSMQYSLFPAALFAILYAGHVNGNGMYLGDFLGLGLGIFLGFVVVSGPPMFFFYAYKHRKEADEDEDLPLYRWPSEHAAVGPDGMLTAVSGQIAHCSDVQKLHLRPGIVTAQLSVIFSFCLCRCQQSASGFPVCAAEIGTEGRTFCIVWTQDNLREGIQEPGLVFVLDGNSVVCTLFASSRDLNDGKWHKTAIVYDASEKTVKLYLSDGQLETIEFDVAQPVPFRVLTVADGALSKAGNENEFVFPRHQLRDVRIFARALTGAEVGASLGRTAN